MAALHRLSDRGIGLEDLPRAPATRSSCLAESGLGLIPVYLYPAPYGDVRPKGK